MNRKANTRSTSRVSVLAILAIIGIVLTGVFALAASPAGASARFAFIDTVTSWFGGETAVNRGAETRPTPDIEAPVAVNSITSLGVTFTENFNGIGNSNTAALPTAWVIDSDTTYSGGLTATILAGGTSGTGVLSGTSSGASYNFANGVTASSTDRAVGFLSSGSYTSPRNLYVKVTNNTGSSITALAISYDIEKYRSGSRGWDINLYSGTDGSTWTARTAGDQNYPADANNTTVFDPPSSVSKSVVITGLSVANGADYYFRWAYTGSGGSTNAQGLGIDNFSITAGPFTRLVATTGTDSGNCISAACATIAYAIGQAIAGDTISVAAGTYTQSSITVDKSLTITGAGASTTIVQANASPGVATTRLFVVNSGVTATISGLTIRNGNIADDGGGILNHGDLTLNNSIVSGNRSNGSSNWGGGGIANGTLGAATLTLNNTTVSGNASINSFSGGMAGGIWHASGTMTINSSTISGNTADIDGGGVYNGFLNAASLTINNSTISGNSAINNGGGIYTDATVAVAVNYSTIANNTGDSDNNATGDGGGAYRGGSGAFSLKSSIIAGNKRGTNTTALGVDCAGSSFTSAGYNLSGASTGCPSGGTGDATVVPATVFTQLLGPLASNGGNTQTHALLTTATPALNQIASGTNQCGTAPFNLDQRGSTRPFGGTCDKGAYEFLVTAPATQASSITFSSIATTSMTVGWTNGDGTKRIVKANTSNSFTNPTDGQDNTANSSWQNAGEQLVYSGSGSSFSMTNLSPGTTYWFRVYEANGSGATIVYNTAIATNNPNNQTTVATYTVTYNGNGNTGGSAPVDGSSPYTAGSTVTVLGNTGSLTKTGEAFYGWNTQADGLGTNYAPASTFAINSNTTLYAKWVAVPSSLTVNDTGDGADAFAGNGVCETAAGNGICTLRAAIQEANGLNNSAVTINFGISGSGVKTIAPLTALPTLTGPVSINGYTQTGASQNTLSVGSDAVLTVQISGTNIPSASGLSISSGGYTTSIRGLVINNFSTGTGISTNFGSHNVTIAGCFIGTDSTGNAAAGNAVGVLIQSRTFVGDSTPAGRNVISGNTSRQVHLSAGFTNAAVVGNYIGTNKAGTAALAGGTYGVYADGATSNPSIGSNSGVTNGGACTGGCNLISGHSQAGITLDGSSNTVTQMKVVGNYIGTDVNGTAAIPNGRGITLTGASVTTTTIGGATAASRNIISGNTADGVQLTDGGTVSFSNNYVGVQTDGASALGNGGIGLLISGGFGVTVNPNTIAFNGAQGVWVTAANPPNNPIRGNSIFGNGTSSAALGIDLGTAGVTANDNLDGDTGPNDLQNFPVITLANGGSTTVSGTLNSTAGSAFTIDVYSNDACNSLGNGEGKTLLGSVTTSNTDGSGNVSWNVTVPTLVAGKFITATATNSGNGTSEFSQCFTVPAYYTVTYDGNSNTGGSAPVDGSSPYAAGSTVTVLGQGTLLKSGFAFAGWNTAANGSGTDYAVGSTFTINANTTLYAKWVLPQFRFVATGGSDAGPNNCLAVGSPCATVQNAHDQANSGDTISIAAGTYTQSNILITKHLFIVGASAATTIIQANASPGVATNRVFSMTGGPTVSFSNVTIRHGGGPGGSGVNNLGGSLNFNSCVITLNSASISAGGILGENVSLVNSTVSGNTAASQGGGVWYGTSLTVSGSTISGNSAGGGGGTYGPAATISNSTISGNTASSIGGGMYLFGNSTISYSTIANNTSSGQGGGIYNFTGVTLTTSSSIVAGNKIGASTTAADADCRNDGTFTSNGYNLTGSGTSTGCTWGGTGDATVAPANVFTTVLGSLASNGGPTQTHALLSGSPALDQIANGTNQCGTAPFNLDQRGSTRPSGGTTCDKGAYELLVSPPSLQKLFQNSSMNVGSQQLMTISVSNPNSGTTLTGVAWSDTLPTGLSTNGDSGPDPVCGGSFTKSGATITLTGASIAPLDTCAISFAVIANGAATGLITNTTNAVTSTNGGTGNTGSANVTVTYPKKFRSLSVLGGGNWNSTATWEQSTDNGSTWQAATTTPTSADGTVEIGNHLVIVTANVTVDEVTGAAGGSIQINSGVTLTVADGAGTDLTIGNSGQLDIFGAVVNNGQVQINGQLTRFSASSSVTGAPSYGSSAIIYYAASGINRTDEWLPNVTSGAGYPKHVTLQSGSFNLPNGVTNQPFQMGGDLTVTGGFSMGAMTSPLTVVGNVHVNPGASNNLQLSTAAGGDLNVGGNFTVVGTGSLTPNGRTVTFNGTGNQVVSTGGTGTGHTFAGFTVNKASGSATLAGDLSASTLNVTAGTFDQGATFSVSSGAATVGGSGVWTNNGTGDLTLSGNVSNAGSIAFDGGGPGACGADSIAISSSVNGTQRAWSGAGTFSMTDVDVRDQAGSATIIVLSGTNNLPTNGANWLFVPVCSSGSYTWTGTVSTDWAIAGNWTPTRTAPGTSDVLYIDGSVTPAPTITNVGGASGETVAALNLTAGTQPNLSASTSAKTVTLAGTSGAALNIDSTSIMTLSGSTALTISVATGSTASIGGGVILGGGAHRLIGADANAVTFASGGFCTTTTGFSGNAFGDGSTGNGGAGSVIFQSGANYFHSAGSSPFGNASNAAVAVFQTGSTARFFTASGFESGGRTYADLAIGRTDPGGVAVAASGSGTGDFQFDNLSINSPVGSNSSLTHNGSGASLVRIRGNITSNGAGSGTLPDVTITAGSNNIVIGKVGGGTITFGNDGSNTRGVQFENNTTVATGTTLALNRVVLLGLSQPNTKIFQINAANGLTGGASGYVIGNVRQFFLSAGTDTRTFNVGTVNGYSPVDTTMTVTDAGMNSLTVGAVQAVQPNISGANAISRYWKLASSFVGTGSADLTFNYLQGDVAPATEANLRLFKYDGSFTQVAATYDNNTNTATATGISSFSDWTLAEPSAVPQPPTVTTDAGSKLFIARYITANAIARVNVDGTGLSANHFAIPSSAIGVTVDTVNGKLYWSTLAGGGSVGRMNLDGSGVEPNFLPGVYTIGMAVDTVNGWLYMTGGAIKRVRLDGTGFETLIPGLDIPAVTSCSGIALDVPNNKLYYAFNTNIGRANLDGTGHNPTYIATGSGAAADDVAIDRVNNKLYWTVRGGNKIGRANVDGTGINGAFMSVTAPRSLIIDPQAAKIFWSDGTGVGRSDLDGTGANPSFIAVSGSWGIAVGDVDVEGTQAVRTGTYSDPNGDAVTISVSAGPGSVTQTGTSSGSWTWTYTPPDGPANPNVTITATDSTSLTSSTNFTLNVNNVAPTIALTGNSNVTVSTAYSLDLGAITDPGTDTVTGYSINWGDGNTETFAPDPPTGDTRTHTYATTGSKTISVSLTDEDGTHLNAGVKTVVVDPPPAETSIAVSGGNLTITDDNGGNSNDNLTITCTPPNIIINDPGNTLSAGPGGTQVDPNTVSVPIASITGSITINTLGGNDSLTLNLSGCDLIPVGGLSFNGGENTGDDDGMSIVGGNQGTVTYGYGPTNGDGTVAMSNYGTITYTGLEPISNTGTATDVIFNLPAGPTNAVTLLDIGGGNSRLSGATFEQTDFANPTGSATINRGNAADTVDVNALATNYPSLTIGSAGGGEFAAIDFNGAVTFGSDKNLSGFATGTISFTDPTSDLATSGTGTIALTTATNVTMLSGSSLTTVNGSLTINANQQALPTTTAGIGINMNNATIHSTGTGVVVVNARGGTGPGIAMDNGSIIRGGSTSGSNTTIVNGMGGTGGNVHGMQIGGGPTSVTGSKITSIGGNISVTGTGGAGGGTSHGIILYPSGGSAGTITGPANASVVVTGTGGTGGGNNIGVLIDGLFSRIGTSGTGTVSVTGTGVGASDGVQLSRDGVVTTPTGAGAVTITGTMGTSGFGIHMNSNGNSTIGSSPHGTVNLIADTMHLSAGFVDTNGAGTVNIRQKTNNQPIGLGAADSASLLGLTDAELNRVIAGTLTIGNGNSGAITTSGAVPINLTDAPAIPNLNLVTSANLVGNISGNDIFVSTLNITAPTGIGALGNSLDIDVTTLTTNTSGSNGDQHIVEQNTATVGTGDMNAGSGTLRLVGRFNTASGGDMLSDVLVRGGGILGGVGAVSTTELTTVESGGAISPGTSPGILSTGPVTFNSGSAFNVELNGTTPGTGHDQLNATGNVALGNATLSLSSTFSPTVGQTFVIINNVNSGDDTTGTFNGIADGSTISNVFANGYDATINYNGGVDGNDVVLTAVAPPSDVVVSAASLPDFGSVTVGNYSAAQTYNVSGTFLTANIVVTAPANFEVSLSPTSGFGSSVSIAPTSGTVTATPIYVRFAPGAAGALGGNVLNASKGATTENVAVTGTGVAAVCTAPPSGLVASYKADGNANDSQGPTFENASQAGSGGVGFVTGKSGQAFSFNGSNWLDAGSPTPLAITGNAVSMEAWVNPTNASGDRILFGRSLSGANSYVMFLWGGALSGGVSTTVGSETFVNTGQPLPINTWSHIAMVYDGSAITIYLNGTAVGSTPKTGTITDTGVPFTIGGRGAGGSFGNSEGAMDEVQIYDRPLSASEVASRFNGASASGMTAWYSGENNANDRFGVNNGTLQNGAGFAAGKVGQAFSLDGSNDFVDVGDLDLPSNFTIDAWVNPTSLSNNPYIFSKDNGVVGNRSYYFAIEPAGTLVASVGNTVGGFTQYRTNSPVIVTSTWQHVAVAYDGAAGANSKMLFYVNGVVAPAASLGGLDNGGTPLNSAVSGKIGIFGDGASGVFGGLIDEVELFGRTLSGTEIASIYNASTAGKCLAPEIVVEEPINTGLTDNISTSNFGSSNVGTPGQTNTFTVRNTGTTTLNITVGSITIDGANPGDFVLNTGGMSPTVSPNGNTAFTVQFMPSAGGVRSANLHIPSDDADEDPFDVALTGTGLVPGTLSFKTAPYTDGETNADHAFTVTVQRTIGSDGIVGVTYATSAGTATAGTDYTETTNTLSWGNGDTADKTFNITVKGDTVYEANETVNLTLSAATGGASIGAPNPTTLTITNDDPPPTSLVVNATGDTDDGFCLPLASGNNCTLREAVNAANLNVDANTITFNIPAADPGCTGPACTITLGGTQLTLANNVSIDGAGPNTITVSGNNASRVFQVNSGILATINGLTISGGNASSGGGAGILNNGTLSVTGSTLSNNSCAAGNLGGGIYGESGSLTVTSSTISGNSAGGGGGGIWTDGGTLSITNTTISNNVTPESGGGLTVLAGTATLINTTITNNRSNTGGGGGPGGGITSFGTITLHNTIVVGNFNGSGSTAGNFPYTASASSSNNLLGQGGAGSLTNGVNGNQIILDSAALLGPLASNSGPTQTHALLVGSPAIDTGSACVLTLNGCAGGNPVVATDQRGTTRPRGLGVDIGAFEVVDCVPQPANMVTWYSGENHFNDIQGPTFESGAASGTVGFTAGKVGQAFNFTASGFANMGTPAPLAITGNQITLDGWVKPTAVSDAVYFGRSASGANDYLLLNQFGGLLSAIIKTNTGETIVNAPGPPVGQWSHIALTYDGSMMRLYMNGVEVGSTPKTGNITNSGQPFGIGGRTSGLRFNGAVDEVEVFNRALSAAEIANIYGADTFGKCKYGLIEFTSPTYTVGEAGTNASITVRRTDGSKGAVSATFNTSDGTATTAGLDYTTTSTTVNFANGDTADKTVLVPINDDMIDEVDETVNAALTSPSGGAFVGPQGAGVLTITDNDAAAASIGNVTQVELNSSTSSFAFPVSLSLQRSTPTTINYSMADGSATGGSDFVSVSGSITIPALTTIGTINVTVNGDTTYEANETFTVTITSPDVGIGTGTGTGTITNDDAVPATVVVNTTADTDDGFCLPLGQGNGCSLREAMDDANQSADATTINFGIPNTDPGFAGGVYTIRPTGALSQVSTAMTIDGTTQTAFNGDTNPNGPEVVVNGSLSGGGLTAFHLTGSAVKIVKGLVINAYGAAFGGVASNYQILDNYVGTNAAGTAAVANNGGLGLGAGSGNTITGNLISGNTAYGISTCDVTNSTFSNNKIGTDRTGTANVGNGAEGFSINCINGNNNTISGNTIAFNGTDGLRDAPDYPTTQHFNNRFTQNSIFSNGEQGIDLWPGPGDGNNDGVTPNDNMDPDAGANNLQNFPVITSAYVSGSTKAIRGTLNTNPNSIAGYTIEFFANAACDSVGGNGEGQTYLGAITTSGTDASGNVTPFVFNPAVLTVGQFITATATDSAGNTSEFSACTQVVTGTAGTIEFALDPYSVAENAGPAVITVTRVGGTQGAITATFDTSNGTATAGSDYTAVNGVVFSYADGETGNKTVNVPLLDDGIFELDETVNLSLSNTTVTLPNGETFMAPSADTAILTITNDEVCVPNPVVTINADSGVTSLRQAVLEACAGSTITFAPGPVPGEESPEAPSVTSPISLSGGQIVIDKNVTIQGPGASVLTVQNTQAAGPTSRIFLINSGVTATISGLTLTGGNTTTADGGAVNNAGVLTLTNMVITANTGGSTVANGGGGISNTGTLNLNSSTISNNVSGGGGGGLLMVNGGTANISGSTFSGNTSTGGSAVLSQAITIPANLSVTNSTISGNTGTPCPGIWNLSNGATATATVTSSTVTNNSGAGGGICAAGPTTVRSSIVAAHQNNTVNADVTGAFTSQGFNLIGNVGVATGFTQPTDQTGTGASPLDPMLAALANNGGPTQTHALNPASPAADKGIDAVVPLVTDQRGAGFGRTVNNPAIPPAAGGDNTDIGAFEIQNTPPTISAVAATRQEGSPVSNSTIANVTDAESGNGGVVVTVTSANPSNGVTISNIVNTSGVITADVVAACGATTATFTLTATDGGSLTATATLTVTVTANTQPVLTYNNPPAIVFGAGTVVNPATGPSDNGSVTSTVLQSAGTYTGTISVHPTNGTVTISNAAPVGTHTITIRATDNCGAFTDSTFQLTVNKADTTTALTSNANPSVFGQPVTFTATISVTAPGSGTPTGTVTFKDNGVNIGTCAAQPVAANVATCTISTLSVGTHPITAVYNGDGSFNASTSNTVNQVVGKADTTTTVTASPVSPSVFGQSVTFTATVAVIPPGAGSPTGTVSFNIDGNIYCANTPINGSFQATCTQAGLPALPAGVRNVVAVYNGDANFNGSAGTLNYTVNKANTATAILNDTPDPSLVNQPYTVTWTVTAVAPGAGTPTGTVTVNGGTGGGSCTAAVAAGGCQLIPTTIGVKTISATYNGDANFNTSTSATASHTVHLQISGTVVQAPAMTPLSGVTITLSGCASQTTTTDAAGNYAFAGAYTGNCTVAPSGLGKIYDPISRTYTAITNNVAGANFTAYNSAADVPRTLTMVNQYVVPGAAGSMPVVLNSQDNESSVAFSFSYDINPFSQPPTAVCGANAPGCTLTLDTSVFGRVGVTVVPAGGAFTRPDGTTLEGPEAAGPKEVARINFQTVATATVPSTPLTFVSTPTPPLTLDAANNPLLTTYVSGLVVFAHGIEGDVAARNAGSGLVDSSDVVQLRRFVTGLDIPVVTHNEFQRADTAPSSTKGNGVLDATDVIQTRRYATGLDGPVSAGGPGQAIAAPMPPPVTELANAVRELKAGKVYGSTGSRVVLPVEMRAAGDEAAISFTVRYDHTRLGDPSVELAGTADGLTLTANTEEPSVIRVLVDADSPFVRSSRDASLLVNVSFDVVTKAPTGETAVTIEDLVVSDSNARSQPVRSAAGSVSISGPNAAAVSISGRVVTAEGAGLRNATVTITDAAGQSRTVTTGTFGYYRFDGVAAGGEYTLAVSSRRYRFAPRRVVPGSDLAEVNFTAQE